MEAAQAVPPTPPSESPSALPPPSAANAPSNAPSPPPPPTLDWIKVAKPGELQDGMRKRLPVCLRDVTIYLQKGKLYCMDSVCFHSGGPLTSGTIQDIEGITCVVCPWHGYSFNLSTGELLYFNLDEKLCSKGCKQITHPIEEREDGIYVQMAPPPCNNAKTEVFGQQRDSRHYAYQGMYKKYEPKGPHIILQFEDARPTP